MVLVKRLSLWLMGAFYVFAGIRHFTHPDFYMQIMPTYLPWHGELVFLSGVAEVLLGIGVVIPRFTRPCAWGIIALLIAVYPANIHMWWNDVRIDGTPTPPYFHAVRLPFQLVFIAWAYWYTRPGPEPDAR